MPLIQGLKSRRILTRGQQKRPDGMPDAGTDRDGGSRATSFSRPLSRRTMLRAGAGVLGVLTLDAGARISLPGGSDLAVGPAPSSDDVVIQWNNAALQAVRDVNHGLT